MHGLACFEYLCWYEDVRLCAALLARSELALPDAAVERAKNKDFELAGYRYSAAPESTRKPRVVRIGLVQNKIVLPTTAPVAEQVRAGSTYVCLHTWSCTT